MSGRLYPWSSVARPLGMDISVGLDGNGLPPAFRESQHRRIDLGHVDAPSWQEVTLTATLAAPEPLPASTPLTALRAHLTLRAPSTALRLAVALAPTGDGRGWTGSLPVSRSDLAGVAHLEAVLTHVGRPKGRVFGRTAPWTLIIDPGAGPSGPSAGPIKTLWVRFADAAEGFPPELRQLPDSLSFCDMSGSDPVLYLNEGVTGLQPVLDDDSARGVRRRLRDHFGAMVATEAVAAMAEAAVHGVAPATDDDDEPQLPDSRALVVVLETIAEHADWVSDRDELIGRILEAKGANDVAKLSSIVAMSRSTAQSLVGARGAAEDLISGVLDD